FSRHCNARLISASICTVRLAIVTEPSAFSARIFWSRAVRSSMRLSSRLRFELSEIESKALASEVASVPARPTAAASAASSSLSGIFILVFLARFQTRAGEVRGWFPKWNLGAERVSLCSEDQAACVTLLRSLFQHRRLVFLSRDGAAWRPGVRICGSRGVHAEVPDVDIN